MAAIKNYWRRLSAGSAWGPTPVVPTDELSNLDCDMLFTWHQSGENFEKLTADSLIKAGICGINGHAHARRHLANGA